MCISVTCVRMNVVSDPPFGDVDDFLTYILGLDLTLQISYRFKWLEPEL